MNSSFDQGPESFAGGADTAKRRADCSDRPPASYCKLHAFGESIAAASKYDGIGVNYAEPRNPDPLIAKMIRNAVDDTEIVLNIGAGTWSYEPTHGKSDFMYVRY